MKSRCCHISAIIGVLYLLLSVSMCYASDSNVDMDEKIIALNNDGNEISIKNVPKDSYDGYICVLKDSLNDSKSKSIKKKAMKMDDEVADIIIENKVIKVDSIDTIESITNPETVEYIEPDYLIKCDDAYMFNDPYFASDEWIYNRINIKSVWKSGIYGMGQGNNDSPIVAVIDTGLVGAKEMIKRHDDIDYSKVLDCGWDSTYSSAEDNKGYEKSGHGTFVTGQICARMNNNKGNVGLMPEVGIIPYKTNNGEVFPTSRAIEALNRLKDMKLGPESVDVINMSFSCSQYSATYANACQAAADKGIILVASAGNSGNDEKAYPASYPGVISVGAINSRSERASFSQYNDCVDVVAPGVNINGLDYLNRNTYKSLSGTSMSAPIVSSMAAMLKSLDSSMDYDMFMKILKETSSDLGTKGRDDFFGYGCVNFWKAYAYIVSDAYKKESINVSIPQTDYEYTGIQIKPGVTVKSSLGHTLRNNIHYSVEYSNNVAAGTATITIKGKGRYAGKSATKKFTIRPQSVASATASIPNSCYRYTGCALKPEVTVYSSQGRKLVEKNDYTVNYSNNVNIGTATIKIIGKGNYSGLKTITFIISNSSGTKQKLRYFKLAAYDIEYNAGRTHPAFSVGFSDGAKAARGTNYEIVFENDKNVGIATVTARGIGAYEGELRESYRIIPQAISGVSISAVAFSYTGGRITPAVKVTCDTRILLRENRDYTVSYFNNCDVGTAKIAIQGIGNFCGSLEKTFEIKKASISSMTMSLSQYEYTYNGEGHYPDVTIESRKGRVLMEGEDYEVRYIENINVGTATVYASGINNYHGNIKKTFRIIEDPDNFEAYDENADSYEYVGSDEDSVAKKTNPIKVKAIKQTINFKKLKNKKVTIPVQKVFSVKKAKGRVKYIIIKNDKKAKRKINVSVGGHISIKKGLKKGTYKVKVRVTAMGNKKYKSVYRIVTVVFKVK